MDVEDEMKEDFENLERVIERHVETISEKDRIINELKTRLENIE